MIPILKDETGLIYKSIAMVVFRDQFLKDCRNAGDSASCLDGLEDFRPWF